MVTDASNGVAAYHPPRCRGTYPMPDVEERFSLTAGSAYTRGRALLSHHRAQRADADRAARRERDYAEFQDRAFLVMAGLDLVEVIDPRDGRDLTSVAQSIAD